MIKSLDIIIPAYNADSSIDSTLKAIFDQLLPADLELGVIVVNNLSTDKTVECVDQWLTRGVHRVDYSDKQGRAPSINAGVTVSSADYVMILDADCCLLGTQTLYKIANCHMVGMAAGFGYTTSYANDFWGKYHRSLELRRRKAGWRGWTTACCVVKRDSYNQVGGFSTSYQHYGFEDRDFICRLRKINDHSILRSLPQMQASHNDNLSVEEVCRKMYQSGRYSSRIFIAAFPEAYRDTAYRHIDYKYSGIMVKCCLFTLICIGPMLIWFTDILKDRQWLPFVVRCAMVKLCSAVSYFRGSFDREYQR